MAGIAVELPIKMEGLIAGHGEIPPRKAEQTSPESPSMLRQAIGGMKVSPQGKGVGIFDLEGSPTMMTNHGEEAVDPKVCQVHELY